MNKKESAELEEAKTQAALRWTGEVERDVEPPPYSAGYSSHKRGWDISLSSLQVWPAWTEANANGRGEYPTDGSRSINGARRDGRALYSTKTRALQALRFEVEKRAASDLRAIDLMIEEQSR